MRPQYREQGFAGTIRTLARRFADLVGAYRFMPNMAEMADGSVWVKIRDGNGVPITGMLMLPEVNEFIEDEECRAVRSDTAMEMMDPDVYGYMLFLLKRGDNGEVSLEFRTQTLAPWVGAFTAGFGRVIEGVSTP